MRKNLVALVLLLVALNAQAIELKNYNEVKSAIVNGKSVHIVLHYENCKSERKGLVPDSNVCVFSPSVMQVASSIKTAFSHFTLNAPGFPNSATIEYVNYEITGNNHVIVNVTLLDPRSYTPLMEKMTIDCVLNESAKVYA